MLHEQNPLTEAPVTETSATEIPATETEVTIGRLGSRFESVQSIAILRGGGIGDVIFAVPAAWALRAVYPNARVALLGAPVHRALFERIDGPFDEVVVVPPEPGVSSPPDASRDDEAVEAFLQRMRECHFDLAIQLHGGGRFSNAFLHKLGARHTVGARTPGAAALERNLDYVYYQHEFMRALEVVGLAGAPVTQLEPQLTAHPDDVAYARAAVENAVPASDGPLVVVHPGASDPRRRWPVEQFALVCAALAAEGARVVIVGDGDDVQLASQIVEQSTALNENGAPPSGRIVSLAGMLSLGHAAGLFTIADVMLGNDSGPRHLAHAVGCRTAAIYWFGNVINAGPLGRGEHRVQLSWTTNCPECGRDCTRSDERCEHDSSFVADVPWRAVLTDVQSLTATSLQARGK